MLAVETRLTLIHEGPFGAAAVLAWPPRIGRYGSRGISPPDPRLDSRQAEALKDLSVRRSFTVTPDYRCAGHQRSGFALSHIDGTN